MKRTSVRIKNTLVDLGEAPPPLLWVRKRKEITEGRKACRVSKTTAPPPLPRFRSRPGSAIGTYE